MKSLETERLILKFANPVMTNQVLDFYERNAEFLEPFEALHSKDFYTLKFQEKTLAAEQINAITQNGVRFYIYLKNDNEKIIGSISLTNIIRGNFQSAFMGYKMDKNYINNGYMTEAVKSVCGFAFGFLHLHRIEANVMPRNIRSQKVLEKNGFTKEGLSEKYLHINGIWEDHTHFALINENFSF